MKKIFALIILFASLNTFVHAQKWTEMMRDPKANFYDIVKEFDAYWKDRPYERGQGFNVFKRWQYYMEPRVFPSGDLSKGSHAYAFEQFQTFLKESNSGKHSNNATITSTTANWTPLGPFGSPINGDAGRVQAIKMHPAGTNTFYVGAAAGGFWLTYDGGASYTTTTDQLGSCGISDIAIDPISPNIIYISTGDKDAGDTPSIGILKSTDGGLTWSPTGLTWLATQQRRIYSLLINPVNPNILIAATSQGMYRSVDAGVNWVVATAGYFVDAKFRPGDPSIVHAVSSNSYIKSSDGGASYSSITIANPLNSNRLSLAVTPANNNYVYILVSNNSSAFGGLYRSTNVGATYSLMSTTPNVLGTGTSGQGWYSIAIDASPANADEITVGSLNTYKSINGGVTWALNTHWTGTGAPYVHADLHCVTYATGNTYFLGTDGGVARTTDGGNTWTTINANMNIAQIYKMSLSASTPSRIIAGHQDNGTNLMVGNTWTEIYGGDGMDCFIDWNNNNTLVFSSQNGNFNRSTNGGFAWGAIQTGLTGTGSWVSPIVQSPSNPNIYYCAYQNVFKSVNQGVLWTQVGNIGSSINEIKISPSNTNVIYVTNSGAVYKTSNDGANWANVTGSIPSNSASITDLAMDNTNPNKLYVTLSGYSSGNKVYTSSNGGITWSNYSTGLPNIPINCIVYVKNSPQSVFVGTDVGVYYREASMSNWVLYNSGMPNIVVNDLEIYYPTGKLRAATYARGVWETDLYSNPGAAPVAAYGSLFSPACVNTSFQFTDFSSNNPTAWNWTFTGASPATSTVQNPSVSYATTGIYTVSLISSNGNGTSTAFTSTISVVNAPTVAATSVSVCSGQVANVSAATNGNIINWATGQQGFVINVNSTATAVYDFTASIGACNTSGASTLTVDNPPGTPTIMVIGNYLTTNVVAQSYQWYLDGNPIPGETLATFTPVLPGFYSVIVNNGLCTDYSDNFEVNDIGLKELGLLTGLQIGPNPVKDNILVSFKNAPDLEVSYEILNALGQTVAKSNFKIDNDKQAKINVQNLAAGIYYFNLRRGEKQNSYKFIKQ